MPAKFDQRFHDGALCIAGVKGQAGQLGSTRVNLPRNVRWLPNFVIRSPVQSVMHYRVTHGSAGTNQRLICHVATIWSDEPLNRVYFIVGSKITQV